MKLVPVKASGAPDDDVAAKADAIKVATEVHAFASFGGPGQTTAYAEELAARGVLCVGDCVIAEPQSFLDRHAPYVWPTIASPEQASEHWAAFVGTQLAGRKAAHAGDAGPDVEGAACSASCTTTTAAGTFGQEREALRAAAGVVQGEGGRDRAVLARPDHRAAGRPQRDREAEELPA